MVKIATAIGATGLQDWLLQRVSAVILLAYIITLLVCMGGQWNYAHWQMLFQTAWFQIFSTIAVLSLVVHAWIGIWTVSTDYIKPLAARLTVQIAIILYLLGNFIWGVWIIWS